MVRKKITLLRMNKESADDDYEVYGEYNNLNELTEGLNDMIGKDNYIFEITRDMLNENDW